MADDPTAPDLDTQSIAAAIRARAQADPTYVAGMFGDTNSSVAAAPQSPLPPNYVNAVKRFEGYSSMPTWDYKQWTSGYGTRAAYPGERIDQATADSRLQNELWKAANAVDTAFPGLPQGPRAALASLTYNAGPGWISSGLGNAVRSGDWPRVQALMQQYSHAGGQTLPGLVARRREEANWVGGAEPYQGPPPTDNPMARPSSSPPGFNPGASAASAPPAFAGAGSTPGQSSPEDTAELQAMQSVGQQQDMPMPAPLSLPQPPGQVPGGMPANALRLRNALAARGGQGSNAMPMPPSVAQRLAVLIGKA
jgi:lysozyme